MFYPGCELEEVCGLAFQLSTATPEMGRLKAGFLIREIFDRFNNKINGDLSPDRSVWIYSAHDSTIANVLNTLELFQPHFPPYASTIMFELYQTNGDYYVQIFYKNTTSVDLKPLNIPRCGPKCSLSQLNKVYAAILPTKDFESECRWSTLRLSPAGANVFKIGNFSHTFELDRIPFGFGLLIDLLDFFTFLCHQLPSLGYASLLWSF